MPGRFDRSAFESFEARWPRRSKPTAAARACGGGAATRRRSVRPPGQAAREKSLSRRRSLDQQLTESSLADWGLRRRASRPPRHGPHAADGTDQRDDPVRENKAQCTGSALMYMPHGLRSRGSVAVARILSCASADTGAAIDAAVNALAAIAAINAGRRKKWHVVLIHAPEISGNCISTGPFSHRTATRPTLVFQYDVVACRQ